MSYTNLIYHAVIRTKYSRPTIETGHERDLYGYIYTFMKAHECMLYRIGGMPDHIHILMSMPPRMSVSDFMRDLKTATSKFLRQNRSHFPMFEGWGKEYYASSVSLSDKEQVRQYIMGQKEHHAKISLHEELLRLCRDNGIDINEQYL